MQPTLIFNILKRVGSLLNGIIFFRMLFAPISVIGLLVYSFGKYYLDDTDNIFVKIGVFLLSTILLMLFVFLIIVGYGVVIVLIGATVANPTAMSSIISESGGDFNSTYVTGINSLNFDFLTNFKTFINSFLEYLNELKHNSHEAILQLRIKQKLEWFNGLLFDFFVEVKQSEITQGLWSNAKGFFKLIWKVGSNIVISTLGVIYKITGTQSFIDNLYHFRFFSATLSFVFMFFTFEILRFSVLHGIVLQFRDHAPTFLTRSLLKQLILKTAELVRRVLPTRALNFIRNTVTRAFVSTCNFITETLGEGTKIFFKWIFKLFFTAFQMTIIGYYSGLIAEIKYLRQALEAVISETNPMTWLKRGITFLSGKGPIFNEGEIVIRDNYFQPNVALNNENQHSGIAVILDKEGTTKTVTKNGALSGIILTKYPHYSPTSSPALSDEIVGQQINSTLTNSSNLINSLSGFESLGYLFSFFNYGSTFQIISQNDLVSVAEIVNTLVV